MELRKAAGEKEGLWHDFSTGQGGNIFHLVQQQKGLSFREVVDYCAWFLGISGREVSAGTQQRIGVPQAIAADTKEKAARLASVADLYQKSQKIKGTVAETYLRKERGIRGALPADLRFLLKDATFTYNDEQKTLAHDCFSAFGRNANGDLCSVQLTKLNEDGTRACNKEGGKLNKIQYGVSKGSFVILQSDRSSNRVFIAEGVETALSIKEAGVQGTIVASMGIHNIKNYEGPEHKVTICADNDGVHARTNQVILHAQKHFETQGKSLHIVKPREEGQDFNEVLKEGGKKAVQAYINEPALRLAELQQTPDLQEKTDRILRFSEQLTEKFQHLRETPFDADLKRDLLSQAKALRRDPDLLDGLRIINPDAVKQMEILIQEQPRNTGIER